METTFEKIIRKTGMKPRACKCKLCQSQCAAPCKGTPEDMVKIIAAGYTDRVAIYKVPFTGLFPEFSGLQYIAGKIDPETKMCTFFKEGLCELHNSGLKPTEGKLSHHTTEKLDPKKSLTKHVLNEWRNIKEEEFKNLLETYMPEPEEGPGEEEDFEPCSNCDLPDACNDFGCAIKNGVRKDYPIDGVF